MNRELDNYIISKNSNFLKHLGYSFRIKDDFIEYESDRIKFIFGYDYRESDYDFWVHHKTKNDIFNITWIAFIRDNITNESSDDTKFILDILSFVKCNYLNLIDYEYCFNTKKLINVYIESHLPSIKQKSPNTNK